ncbi:leucine-rich repeat domain-containing protein [Bacillus sp. ISL-77]|uniref:leucine-rich repeat domain-containing protein n=1 Tax=Bacillus sp. ISL-77 TaxID=2819138 RepID=UPI0027E1CCF6|nr:leucine-rich repeat domain-containing protein [Bacillus sp. ISL-77]
MLPSEVALQGKTKNLERLSDISNIEKLWLFTVNQAQFDFILSCVRPKIIYIYEIKVEDLSSLELLSDIVEIHLCWNTKATKLWDLNKNNQLKYLSIEDFKKLNDFYPMQNCQSLEKLELSGGIWNTLNIDTLEPLKKLTNLKYLTLYNIRIKNESLVPLTSLSNLLELKISNQLPTEEYARLSVALPDTKCDLFEPYVKVDNPIEGKDIMVIGKRKPFLNSTTDSTKLRKYEEQFREFQDKYKYQYEK